MGRAPSGNASKRGYSRRNREISRDGSLLPCDSTKINEPKFHRIPPFFLENRVSPGYDPKRHSDRKSSSCSDEGTRVRARLCVQRTRTSGITGCPCVSPHGMQLAALCFPTESTVVYQPRRVTGLSLLFFFFHPKCNVIEDNRWLREERGKKKKRKTRESEKIENGGEKKNGAIKIDV